MEAYLDTDPGQGSGTAFSGIGDDELVEKPPVVTFSKSGLSTGTHVISVRAQDSRVPVSHAHLQGRNFRACPGQSE